MKILLINLAIASLVLASEVNLKPKEIKWYSKLHLHWARFYVDLDQCNQDHPAANAECTDLLDRTDETSDCFSPDLVTCNTQSYLQFKGQMNKIEATPVFESLAKFFYGKCPVGDHDCYNLEKAVADVMKEGNSATIEAMKVLIECPKCNMMELCGGGGSPCVNIYDFFDCKDCLNGL